MQAMIIDGKVIANQIQKELREQIVRLSGRKPCLAVIIVGNHPASLIYVERKTGACAETGIESLKIALPEQTSESELTREINKLNASDAVDGILMQLPLPGHINPNTVLACIAPNKDVDGLHPINVGRLLNGGHDPFIPCTPLGIKVLLERTNIEVSGKHAVILGRSNLVGKPMAAILMQNGSGGNATVTVANSYTKNVKELCLMADIIIAAMGQPLFVKADMVKEGAVVIDVGINKIDDPKHPKGYRIVGDVDFDQVQEKCSFITPVPGGIGPMTIAMLLSNTLKSYMQRHTKNGRQ